MKKFFSPLLLLAAAALLRPAAAAARTSQTVKIEFDESMFKIGCTNGVIDRVECIGQSASLPGDTCHR